MPARKKAVVAASRGLDARRLATAAPPAAVVALGERIAADGGSVLATYRDPLGGHWQLLAALPLERVEPTPYQRDLSEAHVKRLAGAIDQLDRYLDPVIAVPADDGRWFSPNGYHRLGAMKSLGAKSIVALVVPEPEVAHRILLLNTEKAHNLRERAMEVARLAEALSAFEERAERDYAAEFEEAALVTLGLCYLQNGRFAGGAFHPVLKRCDKFLASKLPKAMATRHERAAKVMELAESVNEVIASLKSRGFESPYLRAFVVARVNPLRFKRGAADFDETLDTMIRRASNFDSSKIRQDQIARTGGAPDE